MNEPTQPQRQDSGQLAKYYVRRGKRAGRFTIRELLNARTKNRLLSGDEIRLSGTTTWIPVDEYDWDALERLHHLDSKGSDQQASEQGGEASLPRSAAETKSPELPSPESEAEWWGDSGETRSNHPKKNYPWSVFALAILIVICVSFGTIKYLKGPLQTVTEVTQANPSQTPPNSPTNSQEERETEPASTQTDPVADAKFPPDDFAPQTLTGSPLAPVSGSADFSATKENAEAVISPNSPAAESEASTSDPPIPDFDKGKMPITASDSTPEIIRGKTELDKLFDNSASILAYHLKTTESLSKSQLEWNQLTNALATAKLARQDALRLCEEITAQLLSNQVAFLQARATLIQLSSQNSPSAVQELYRAEMRQLESQQPVLQVSLSGHQRTLQSRDAELNVKSQMQKAVVEEIFRLAHEERNSLKVLMDAIDFFGERPIEYHQRVYDYTTTLLAQNPDFLMAYILRANSASQIGEASISSADVGEFEKRVMQIPSQVLEKRKAILFRCKLVGQAVLAASDAKRGEHDAALRRIKLVTDEDSGFVEGWLLRGVFSVSAGDSIKARDYFQKAIRLQPADPRVYRITVENLMKNSVCPPKVLRGLMKDLTDNASKSDWRAWYIASQAYWELGDAELARECYSSISKTPSNAVLLQNLAQKLGIKTVEVGAE